MDRNTLFQVDVHSAESVAESARPFRDCPRTLWTWTPVSRGSTCCSNSPRRTSAWVAGSSTAPISLRLPRWREWRRICRRCWRQSSPIPRSGSLDCPCCQQANAGGSLIDWNDTETSFRRLGTFSERFAKQAERTPNAIAVSAGRIRLSYRELARRSSAIADRLAHGGRRPRRRRHLARRARRRLPGGDDRGAARRRSVSSARTRHFPPARLAQIIQHSRTPLVLAGQGCAAAARNGAVWDAGPSAPASPEPRATGSGQAAGTLPRPVRPAPVELGLRDLHVGLHGRPEGRHDRAAGPAQSSPFQDFRARVVGLGRDRADGAAELRHLGLAVSHGR